MTDEQRAELKRLAEAATPGPWVAILTGDGTQGWVGTGPAQFLKQDYDGEYDANDARYISAANPAAVLDLLSERDALKAENERLRARLARVEAKVREFSHAEACAVDDTFDPDDTDGCVCVLRVLAE